MSLIPEEELRDLCGELDGEWSLYLSIPETEEKLSIRATERMISASTIKLPLLALLLRDGEQGRLDLHRPSALDPENRVGGSGILQSLSPGLPLCLFDCAVLMIALSDNVATNQVIDAVGMERANAFIAEMGWSRTHIGRKMMREGAPLPDGSREQNYTSAADLGDMLERIAAGTLVSQEASCAMRRILAGQRNGKFRPALPCQRHLDPRQPLELPSEGKVILCAKSGTLPGLGVANDAGLLILPNGRRVVLTMLTCTGDVNAAAAVMGRAARTVYETLR